MLFRIPAKNIETIQISHFLAAHEVEDKRDQVIKTFDLLIPVDAGAYVAAAMVRGVEEFFLKKIMNVADYQEDLKDLIGQANQTLEAFEEEPEVKKHKKASGLIIE